MTVNVKQRRGCSTLINLGILRRFGPGVKTKLDTRREGIRSLVRLIFLLYALLALAALLLNVQSSPLIKTLQSLTGLLILQSKYGFAINQFFNELYQDLAGKMMV